MSAGKHFAAGVDGTPRRLHRSRGSTKWRRLTVSRARTRRSEYGSKRNRPRLPRSKPCAPDRTERPDDPGVTAMGIAG